MQAPPEPEYLDLPPSALRYRPKTRSTFTRTRNIVYAEAHGAGLLLDVFAPAGNAKGTAILDVVSGAWHSDIVRFNEHIGLGAIDVFCEQGYHVFAARPGSATAFTIVDMVDHVKAAQRFVLRNAAHFGVSNERYGIIGASAGGHLAALAALTAQDAEELPAPAAIGLFFPPSDLSDFGGKPFDFARSIDMPLDRLLFREGLEHKTKPEIAAAAKAVSPALQVRKNPPPVYLLHGDADPVVPLQQSEKLAAALEAAGGEVEFYVKSGGGHPWKDVREDIAGMVAWFDARC